MRPEAPLLTALLAGSSGCLSNRDAMDASSAAWGEHVASEARPAVRATVGMASTAAWVCGYSLQDWQTMAGDVPALPEQLAEFFQTDELGTMLAYPTRGQYEVAWGGGRFFDEDVALRVAVGTPMTAITVLVERASLDDEEDTETDTGLDSSLTDSTLAMAPFVTQNCGNDRRLVTGNVSFPLSGDLSWALDILTSEDQLGLSYELEQLLPAAGSVNWSGISELGRSVLETGDAEDLKDDHWPATAGGNRWSSKVLVDLRAPEESEE